MEKVTIDVNESFRGMTSPVAETFNYHHSCAHTFRIGQKYLFYGPRDKENALQFATGLCNRTTRFRDDLVDLEFLRGVKSGTPTFWVWGTITEGNDTPLKGVQAEILGYSPKLAAVSDDSGNLKITVPREGKYRVRVHLPKGWEPSGGMRNDKSLWEELRKTVKDGKLEGKNRYIDYEVIVGPNKCGWVDLPLMRASIN